MTSTPAAAPHAARGDARTATAATPSTKSTNPHVSSSVRTKRAARPPAVSGGGCGDPVGWLFGFLGVPTPAYLTAAPTTSGGGTTTVAKATDGATPPACADPSAPIVLAPTGPVTIVLGADVRFAQE